MSYWWCVTHAAVEGSASDDLGCRTLDRLGPFESSGQAANALANARARTAKQDAIDEAEDDWGAR